MKIYKKILFLLMVILIIVGTTYAWKAGGGVKWIGESTESQKDNRFEDHSDNTSDYGTGYYLDTYTNLKWQTNDAEDLAWAKDCSTDSDDDNYCGEYLDPVWTGTEYDYTDKTPVGCSNCSEDDFQAHKYCESLGNGWRLPTKREFMSIFTNEKPVNMNYYTALFSISNNRYWSSVSYSGSNKNNWVSGANYGNMDINYKNYTSNYTICVHD